MNEIRRNICKKKTIKTGKNPKYKHALQPEKNYTIHVLNNINMHVKLVICFPFLRGSGIELESGWWVLEIQLKLDETCTGTSYI